MTADLCALCGRPLPEFLKSRHHLVPKCEGGKATQPLHQICHSKIHSLFSENEIRDVYPTIEKLLANEDIQAFVKWVQKKPTDFTDHNIMSNKHNKKRH